MDNFRAYRIDEKDGEIVAGFQELGLDDLTEGNVVVRVTHSTINYKDALAATGKGKILRRHPLNGGIDFAGVVVSSEDVDFQPGTEVLMNGCGLSETADGGYSEYARVDSQGLVAVPEGMTCAEAMQIGTAGYTAAPRDRSCPSTPGDRPGTTTNGSMRWVARSSRRAWAE